MDSEAGRRSRRRATGTTTLAACVFVLLGLVWSGTTALAPSGTGAQDGRGTSPDSAPAYQLLEAIPAGEIPRPSARPLALAAVLTAILAFGWPRLPAPRLLPLRRSGVDRTTTPAPPRAPPVR